MWCLLEEGLSFLAAAHNKNRLKDELQKMQYLYNDHISGVKIEVQKLYSIKVVCHLHIMTIPICSISPSSAALSWPYILQKEELDRMMRSLSGDSKANIDKILEEFRNAKKVEYVTKKDILTSQRPSGADPWSAWASFFLICTIFSIHYLPSIPHVSIYQDIICTDQIDNQGIISLWSCW